MAPQTPLVFQQVAGQVQFVKTLHHHNGRRCGRIVQPAAQDSIDPDVYVFSFSIAESLLRAEWVINDRSIAAATPCGCSYARSDHLTAFIVHELLDSIATTGQSKGVPRDFFEPSTLQQES